MIRLKNIGICLLISFFILGFQLLLVQAATVDCFSVRQTNNFGFVWGNASWCGYEVQPGDQIGAFVSNVAVNNGCVGIFTVTEPGFYGAMSIYCDDPSTPEKDGVANGDIITFKICNSISGSIVDCPEFVVWDSGYVQNFFQQDLTSSAPVANFSASATRGCVPLSVQFTSNSPGATGYFWDFGDGASSTDPNPSHTYTDADVYSVYLTVSNICGSNTMYEEITVGEVPVADYEMSGGPYCVDVGIHLTSTSSSNATTLNWDFGDGTGATDDTPVHSYTTPGMYTITLTASNECGTPSISKTITVGAPPVASYSISQGPYCVGNQIEFGYTGCANATGWEWNFGDGTDDATGPTVSHTYAYPGTYEVGLIVWNECGYDIQYFIITVDDDPVADFSISEGPYCIGQDIYFSNTSSSIATSLNWDFGDGTGATDDTPVHSYTTPGTYTITLTASNECGTSSISKTITVGAPPVAGYSISQGPYCVGNQIEFGYTGSANATGWEWDFGDNTGTATGPTVSHTYAYPGTFSGSLTVGNECGSDTQYFTITVDDDPVADFSISEGPYCIGQDIYFSNTSSSIATSLIWDFGDGTGSTGDTPVHSYTTPGTYTITLTASNGCGTSSISKTITVGAPPVASYSGICLGMACAGEQIEFRDTDSMNATSWQWYFGDDTYATDQNVFHTYAHSGTYEGYLTVGNECGSDTQYFTITVDGVPMADFYVSDNPSCNYHDVYFVNTSNRHCTWECGCCEWDFGDGTTSTDLNPVHSYTAAGSYTVILHVMNHCGENYKQMVVEILGPDGEINVCSTSGCVPFDVCFGLNKSCIEEPVQYNWDFGDQSYSQDASPCHTYTQPGIYEVAVEATDSRGQVINRTITIEATPFCYTMTNTFASIWGAVEVNGEGLGAGRWVGAFVDGMDINGGCIGAFKITEAGTYGAMAVYGDDPTTLEKNGAYANDSITFKAWDALGRQVVDFCSTGPDEPIWNSAEVLNVNLTNSCGQRIFLNEGWNLISFQVNNCFYETTPAVFIPEGVASINVGPLVAWLNNDSLSPIRDATNPDIAGDWQRITSFDALGAHILDKSLPPFINTLKYLSAGYGYWIKMNKPAVLDLPGQFVPVGTALTLQNGWNLIGYIPHDTCYGSHLQSSVCPYSSGQYTPDDKISYCQISPLTPLVLASINGQYRRITSFDACNGGMIFDTQLPPFINTLYYLGPHYGYWIKIENPTGAQLIFPANCSATQIGD